MQILNKLQDDSYPGMLVAKEIIERVDWIAQIGGFILCCPVTLVFDSQSPEKY